MLHLASAQRTSSSFIGRPQIIWVKWNPLMELFQWNRTLRQNWIARIKDRNSRVNFLRFSLSGKIARIQIEKPFRNLQE